MNFFTPVQLRILKTSWIPVLIACTIKKGADIIFPSILSLNLGTQYAIFLALTTLCMVVWEAVIKKDVKQFGVLAFVVLSAFSLQFILNEFLKTSSGQQHTALIYYFNSFAVFLLIIITRFYLNGMSDKMGAAVLAAVIYFVIPKTGSPTGTIPLGWLDPSGVWMEVVSTLVALLTGFATFISYYSIIFLTENSFRWPAFFIKLQSRIQTISGWEYFFIFFSIWFVYMGSIGELTYLMANFFEGTPLPLTLTAFVIFKLLLAVLCIYSLAGLLRNIITGRALTTGEYNPWVIIMHYIPVINIAAVLKLLFAEDKPATQEEHAVLYLESDRHAARQAMIIAGITVTVYNIYHLLTAPTGLALSGAALLGALYLLKIFAYIKLRSSKTYLLLVMGLNTITILFALNEYLLLSLSFLYLYYYLMQELFYPKLEIEDTVKVQDPDAGDIFTHTA
ncbi:hypothetical protein [Chitinophaga filiformis]|uniref:Uncharacterized protein n=1 Tax=Chitinophaga filiformis TaxID=104663 RepID=A0A1G7IKB3_CHIFI|nr:hypothetical protein [Chitinophaga filiformis]SDF12998.1 hypothetical protein SAMN04488121_101882 [Chitinophaga filiformis]